MGMEHRWASRRPADTNVSIAYRPLGLLRGRLCNISRGGALVQLSTPLTAHAPVELILAAGDGEATRLHRVPAIVTRSSKTSIGLMFEPAEPDSFAALLQQLSLLPAQAAPKQPDAPLGETAPPKRRETNR